MRKRQAHSHRARKRASEIAALVDEGGRLNSDIRKREEAIREIRDKLKQAGRLDLARKFLVAPTYIRDLAGMLWRNQAMVAFAEEKDHSDASVEAALASFPARFTLRSARTNGSLTQTQLEDLVTGEMAKVYSNFLQRTKSRKNLIDRRSLMREHAIELAWMHPLEEWACIFPEAVLAGDTDFIEKIIASHARGPRALDNIDAMFAANWYSMHENTVPPLAYWSDKAACEFICFVTGENLKLSAYKKRKQRLELRSRKPVLVTFAECAQRNDQRLLSCSR